MALLLLVLLPLLLPTVGGQADCPIDSVVNLKMQAALAGKCCGSGEPGEAGGDKGAGKQLAGHVGPQQPPWLLRAASPALLSCGRHCYTPLPTPTATAPLAAAVRMLILGGFRGQEPPTPKSQGLGSNQHQVAAQTHWVVGRAPLGDKV